MHEVKTYKDFIRFFPINELNGDKNLSDKLKGVNNFDCGCIYSSKPKVYKCFNIRQTIVC